jgi:hypothetical protein
MQKFKVGDKVMRLRNNVKGTVIEVWEGSDKWPGRCRIKWNDNRPRTWISFKDLTVTENATNSSDEKIVSKNVCNEL